MDALIYFVLGTFTSVLVNLATPFLQKWVEKIIGVNKGKSLKALRDELQQITELYTSAGNKFIATITAELLFLIGLLALIFVLGIVTIFVQTVAVQMPAFDGYAILGYTALTKASLRELSLTFHVVAWILLYVAILILGIFVTYVLRFSRKIRKVRDFEQYEPEVKKRIRELESNSPNSSMTT